MLYLYCMYANVLNITYYLCCTRTLMMLFHVTVLLFITDIQLTIKHVHNIILYTMM